MNMIVQRTLFTLTILTACSAGLDTIQAQEEEITSVPADVAFPEGPPPVFSTPGGAMPGGAMPGGAMPMGAMPGGLFGDQPLSGPPAPFGAFLILDNYWGESFGWDDDFYNGRAFLPWHLDPGRSLLFTSLGGSVTANGQFIGNFGGGGRWLSERFGRIFGLSAWYDVDDSHTGTYQRAGISFETMGPVFDVRANWYKLFADQSAVVGRAPALMFSGNNIMLMDRVFREFAFDGGDVEVGGLLPGLGRYGMYGYVGGYYINSKGASDAVGVSLRSQTQVTENISVGTQYTYDGIFEHNFFTNLTLTFPMHRPQRCFKPRSMIQRLAEPVQRRRRIPVHVQMAQAQENLEIAGPGAGGGGGPGGVVIPGPSPGCPVVLLPSTAPSTVLFVDPGAIGSLNLGTAENPFTTLEAARLATTGGANAIVVLAGSPGSGAINGPLSVTAPIVLNDGQQLLSTALDFGVVTSTGTVVFAGVGSGPVINNSSTAPSSVVLLSGINTRVSGFTIDGRDGTGVVRHNGISIDPLEDNISTQICGNVFQNAVNGILLNTQYVQVGVALPFVNTPETTPGLQTGSTVPEIPQTLHPSVVTDNIFTANTNAGLLVDQRDDSVVDALQVTGNQFRGNLGDGFQYRREEDADIVSSVPGVRGILIAGNLFDANLRDGIDIVASNGGLLPGVGGGQLDNEEVLEFDINSNIIQNNGFRGIALVAEAASILDVNIFDNDITGNGFDTGNFFTTLYSSGIEARTRGQVHPDLGGGGDGVINGTWTFNRISGNAVHGIAIGRDDNMLPTLTILADNDPDYDIDNPATGVIEVVNEGFNGGGTANHLDPNDPRGGFDLIVSDNTITNNGFDGIHAYFDKSSNFSTVEQRFRQTDVLMERNLLAGNGDDGLDINTAGSAIANIEANDFYIHNNGVDANALLPDGTQNAAFARLQAIDPEFNDTYVETGVATVNIRGDGVESNVRGGSALELVMNRFTIEENEGRGWNHLTQLSGFADVTLADSYVASNGLEGVYVVNTVASFNPDLPSNAAIFNTPGGNGQTAAPFGPAEGSPFTILRVQRNLIDANGTTAFQGVPGPQTDTLGGLVIRVGAAGQFEGDFAADGNAGVVALVEDNNFSGNFGRDVYIDAFVGVDVDTNPIQEAPDPLARLDLRFTGNSGDSIDVANFENAFFNNTNGNPDNKDATNPTRRRDIFFTFDPIVGIPDGPNSVPTFRVELTTPSTEIINGIPVTIGSDNDFNIIYSDFSSFGWTVTPPGTIFAPFPPTPVLPDPSPF